VTKLLGASFALTAVIVTAIACDSSNDDNGSPVDVTDIGQCSAAGGVTPIDGRFPPSAVPDGLTCDASTTCHLPVDDCANDWPPISARVSEYQCDCAQGAWSCIVAVEGTSPCAVTTIDAAIGGGDAGGDDAGGAMDATGNTASDATTSNEADAAANDGGDADAGLAEDASTDAETDSGDS
jgi:hypothetical protein